VIVTVPELVAAVAVAVSVIVCVAPGIIDTDAGFAVTPAGKPEIVIAICALYPFTAVDVTVICCVAPPAVNAALAGVTASVKSCTTLTVEPHPPAVSATQPNIRQPSPNNQRPIPPQRESRLFSKTRVEKSILPIPEVKVHSPAIDEECSEIHSPIPQFILPREIVNSTASGDQDNSTRPSYDAPASPPRN
jgi:hypothetical protein